MRKFWWLPFGLVIAACGGSGINLSFPHTKTLSVEFSNTSGAAIDMGMVGDLQSVAAGASRTESHTRTWVAENQTHTFLMNAQAPGGLASVSITISGKESYGENLNGILVTWNGTQLRAVTR